MWKNNRKCKTYKKFIKRGFGTKTTTIRLSVDRSFIYRIEKQNSILKDFELIAICDILELNLENLKSLIRKDNKK